MIGFLSLVCRWVRARFAEAPRRARPAPRRGRRWPEAFARLAPVVALVGLLAGGCEEDVTAVLGTERPFTLYGVLTPQLDTQWVRVFPIEGRLEPTAPVPLDAHFVSADLVGGERRVWADSLIREPDGQWAHVFFSPFAARFAHTYRLDVTRGDGAVTSVEATVPPETRLVLPAQSLSPPGLLPVVIAGAAPHLIRIEITYAFKFALNASLVREKLVIGYDGAQVRQDEGWRIDVNVARDSRLVLEYIKAQYQLPVAPEMKIVEIAVGMIAANDAWRPPGGVFDADVLVQPGVLSNVENGFGFVGAGYRLADRWQPFDTLLIGIE